MNAILTKKLYDNILALHKNNHLYAAGTGNAHEVNHNLTTRSDVIYWLDKNHNNGAENDFFELIEGFIRHLNMSCYAGITGYEFHYSIYEVGSFYIKHLDEFKNNNTRVYSLICYLNANWMPPDGGELLIHQSEGDTRISPANGKAVFFKSNQLVHEVLLTNKRRLSVTGWLKRN